MNLNSWYIILSVLIFVYIGIAVFFYFYQESFLFHPRKTSSNFKYNFDYPFEEQFYETPNNGQIHSLKFKAADSKGVVFYLHGNAGSLRDWGWLYAEFIPKNYDLVLIDFRSYGKSSGPLSEANMHSDVQFVYDELKKEYAENKIIIYGRSVGTGMAVRLAANAHAKSLVLETPYYSIADIANNLAPIFPYTLLLKYKFESYKYINQVKSPIFIIHGDNDNVVPFKSGNKLYQKAKDKVTFYKVKDGQHNNLSQFNEYEEMLNAVL